MCEKIKRFELVELPIPAGSTGRITFPTVPQLRNQANQYIVLKGIQIYTVNDYANSQLNNSIAGIALTEVPKCVLVLYVNGEESIKMIPLGRLIQNISGTISYYNETYFDDLTNVDFDKSYVQFSAASAGTPYVIPFGIEYIRYTKNAAGQMVVS